MAKFRKKPVVIEAFRLNERGLIAEDWFWDAVTRNDIITHCFGKHEPCPAWCEIKTPEGTMIANAGDYIIQGVHGEIYPCKADIFQKTYTEDKPKTNADRIRNMNDEEIEAVRYRSATPKAAEAAPQPEPPAEPFDNTAAAIIKLLEKLDDAVNEITEAADDICQTVTTARKLNEDCINANFDVLTATLRDGVESVKATIRKGRKNDAT